MSELDKMKKYIERTKMKKSTNYTMFCPEIAALMRKGHNTADDLYDAIILAFRYGQAKGYRCAMKEMRK